MCRARSSTPRASSRGWAAPGARRGLALVVLLAGCGSGDRSGDPDGPTDGPPDAPACPTTLLTGGSDVGAQGWTVIMQGPATLTYGADYTRLETSNGGQTSGQLLLTHLGAVAAGQPFALEVVLQVESASPHNQYDAAAAILGAFTPPVGNTVERGQMIYLEPTGLGWADNAQRHAVALTDGAYHAYVLKVDAAGAASLTIDGAAALTRAGFLVNGRIALGDQTNDPNVDAVTRIRSVRLLCL